MHYPIRAAAFMGLALVILAGLTSFQHVVRWEDWQTATAKCALLAAVTLTCWTLWVWPNRELIRNLVR